MVARPIAKDHAEKRSHILKSAARVFASEGYARASMSMVANACGVSKANIYHYYDSKDALLFDILDSYLRALRDIVCKIADDEGKASSRLEAFLRETLLAYEGMDAEHQIQSEGLPLLPPDQQNTLKGYQRDMVQALGNILHHCAPAVFEADRERLRDVTMSVFGMLNWYYMWNGRAKKNEREAYARLVSRLTLNGLSGLA